MQKEKGITLTALSITIIVLLILSGISINGIFGKSGLIDNVKKSKEKAEIAEEKEIVLRANIIAEGTSKSGNITKTDIEKAIGKVVSNSDTIVIEDVNGLVVKFNPSNRYYIIDNKGDIAGPIEILVDKYPGDPTKGETEAGKTEDNPLIIRCIEDLVVFSRDYKKYESSYVILAKTLDFKSIFSYNDYSSTQYGDLNQDGIKEDIKTELTKQGDTCGGFTPIASFKGTFDGQNNKICNLYENRGTSDAGLFASSSGTIKNLGLENITLTGGENIGGIVAKNLGEVLKCFVEGTSTVSANVRTGLISGNTNNKVTECYSIGNVNIKKGFLGGIVGYLSTGGIVKKCYNIMEIEGNAGGIVGGAYGKTTIEECYHIGDMSCDKNGNVGGIICGTTFPEQVNLKNCYSIGNMNGGRMTGGVAGGRGPNCFNSYSVGKITSSYCGGIINGMNYGAHLVHCFGRNGDFGSLSSYNNTSYGHGANGKINYECGMLADEELKKQDFVDELNNLILADNNGIITETPQTVWKMDTEGINNGYPIFVWQ